MPRVYAYFRDFPGHPVAQQRATIRSFHAEHLAPRGFGPVRIFEDASSSGAIRLCDREQGRRLQVAVDRGDVCVFAAASAGFRDLDDISSTVATWARRGVHLYLLDLGVATPGELGQLLVGVMSRLSEFSRSRAMERGFVAAQKKRSAGKPMNQYPGMGRTLVGPKRARRVVADPTEQAVMRTILECRRSGWRWENIRTFLADRDLKTRTGKEWTIGSIQAAYERAIEGRVKCSSGDEDATL